MSVESGSRGAVSSTKIAVVGASGDVLSHDRLEQRAGRLAAVLRHRGLRRGDVVAVLATDLTTVLEILMAARRSGLVALPVDPSMTFEERAFVVNDAGARAVLVADEFVAGADVLELLTPGVVARYAVGGEVEHHHSLALALSSAAPLPGREEPQGSLHYSSVTHGRPVGTRVPDPETQPEGRRQIAEVIAGSQVGPGIVLVTASPIADPVVTQLVVAVVAAGGTVVVPPAVRPEAVLEAMVEHSASLLHLTTPLAAALAKVPPSRRVDYDLSALSVAVLGAADPPPEVVRTLAEWWGPCLRQVGVLMPDGVAPVLDTQAMLMPREVVIPQQVEHALIAHPAVLDAAVVRHDHGGPGAWLSVIVQPTAEERPRSALAGALEDYLASVLPDLRENLRISFTAQLPRTATGKLDRRRLLSSQSWIDGVKP